MKGGEYRVIPKGIYFWSIHNQCNIQLLDDAIVEITNTCYFGNTVFVKQKQLLFNVPGFIPTLIDKGKDEWEILYDKTIPYEVPKPVFLTYKI